MRGNSHAFIVAARFACTLCHRSGGSALRMWLFSCCCLVWNAAARLVDCPVRDPGFFAPDFFTLPHRLPAIVMLERVPCSLSACSCKGPLPTNTDDSPKPIQIVSHAVHQLAALRLAGIASCCALRHHPLPCPFLAISADLRSVRTCAQKGKRDLCVACDPCRRFSGYHCHISTRHLRIPFPSLPCPCGARLVRGHSPSYTMHPKSVRIRSTQRALAFMSPLLSVETTELPQPFACD
jgi:hypothetical protein